MGASDVVQRWFDPTLNTIREARQFVLASLPPTVDDPDTFALLVSELAANAVLHARTSYQVVIAAKGATIKVDVVDRSHRLARPLPTSGDLSVGGRGLRLVEALSSRWGCDPTPEGKRTWFEITGTCS